MILTPAVGPVIDTIHIAETCASAATMKGPRRQLVDRELLRIGGQLQAMRSTLAGDDDMGGKLGAGFDYLEQHPDPAREAIWLKWLAEYEAVRDTQRLIEATVLT